LHGIESDDYITSELLIGHPPMVDMGCATRGAVRKYWLLQPTARELADCEIASVEYVGGDIHRQQIVWKSPDGKRETIVYVNRGETDWRILEGIILPPFGFYATGPAGIAMINRRPGDGDVVEHFQSKDGKRLYVNGRQRTVEDLLPIRAGLKPDSFKCLGGNRFQCSVLWTAKTGAKLDYSIFVHLVPALWKSEDDKKEGIQTTYGVNKPKPITEWDGEIVTPMNPQSVADDIPAGKYRLLVGMYDSKGDGHRALLMGHDNDNRRYSIGILNVVRGADGKVTELTLEEEPKPVNDLDAQLRDRLAPPKEPFDYGYIITKGAFLVENGNSITPLPDEPATEVSLRSTGKSKVIAVDADGKKIRDVPTTVKDGTVVFTTEKGEFRYVIGE
jgi:hypothetical protein